MSKVLEVKDLKKSFKRHSWSSRCLVLKGLSFSLPKGSALGFLGANGSGKTTSFKCLLELIKKDSGEVLFFGEPLSLKSRARIGFLPERPQFYEELTAKECLYFYSSLSKALSPAVKAKIKEGLKKLGLYEWRNKRLKTFSKGMLQKVGILQSLVHEPDLLILDEPFSGLDPESRFSLIELLKQINQEGCSLFLSSHIFQDVERVCNHLLILKEGEAVFEGDFSQLKGMSSGRQSILYLLNGKKQDITVSSQEECQQKLKSLLSKGAVILSLQSAGGDLEQKYKDLMKASKKGKK